jgi:hypothetical protein
MQHKRGCNCERCQYTLALAKVAKDKLEGELNPEVSSTPRVIKLAPIRKPVKRGPNKVKRSKRKILYHEMIIGGNNRKGYWCDKASLYKIGGTW